MLNPMGRNAAIPRLHTADSSRTVDKTDALWAEMQATLEEVELSASGGTHVFGPEHDRKLADLRAAQIALAQAWARSEADDANETTGGASDTVRDFKSALGGIGLAAAAGVTPGANLREGATDAGRSTVGTGSARPPSSGHGADRLGTALAEETETDILLARKRREANDRYFSKVDQGVRDVVAKLEEVAVAMQAVEQESQKLKDEGHREGLREGKEAGLRAAISDLCELLAVELTVDRRAHLASLDLAGLEALRAHLKQHRAWAAG